MNPSGDDKKYEPSPETNPEPDKPTGSEEEEKEPEKNPSEKPKEEEKGGFVEWYKNNLGVSIPLTIISLIIARMIYFELWQQIRMYKNHAKGICLFFDSVIFDSEECFGSICPFFGLWKTFTNKDRFKVSSNDSRYTIAYSGLKRIGINALAAFSLTFYYDWAYEISGVGLTAN